MFKKKKVNEVFNPKANSIIYIAFSIFGINKFGYCLGGIRAKQKKVFFIEKVEEGSILGHFLVENFYSGQISQVMYSFSFPKDKSVSFYKEPSQRQINRFYGDLKRLEKKYPKNPIVSNIYNHLPRPKPEKTRAYD